MLSLYAYMRSVAAEVSTPMISFVPAVLATDINPTPATPVVKSGVAIVPLPAAQSTPLAQVPLVVAWRSDPLPAAAISIPPVATHCRPSHPLTFDAKLVVVGPARGVKARATGLAEAAPVPV